MRRAGALAAIALWIALAASGAHAHEVRPGYLELREVDAGRYDVVFRVPARGDRRLGLDARLPETCESTRRSARLSRGAYVERWRATCAGGLVGHRVVIEGLEATRTDVLARVERADGTVQTQRLTPETPGFHVAPATAWHDVARTYLALGVGHILLGGDHLLFVLALLFLVGSGLRLVGVLTAFTLAHSLTLAAATLGWLRVPQAPVEAVIALSVVFVAAELLHGRAGRPGLAARRPWIVALGFGLLHGLGFAGALRALGLPERAIPLALAAFNLGVELGQLAFVAGVWALLSALRHLSERLGRSVGLSVGSVLERASAPAAYAIGILATFWLIERTAAFWRA